MPIWSLLLLLLGLVLAVAGIGSVAFTRRRVRKRRNSIRLERGTPEERMSLNSAQNVDDEPMPVYT